MKNNMDQGDVDLSVLRKPIPTSVTGFMSVMKAFGEGTVEVNNPELSCESISEWELTNILPLSDAPRPGARVRPDLRV